VIGTSGSGKTTLARRVAERLELPHVELDALHWDPGWTEAPLELFRERVDRALEAESWVVDGNYGRARDLVWGRAELLVWLDYSLQVTLNRVCRRTLSRIYRREVLWNGNREEWVHFFSRESLLLFVLKTHHARRRRITALLRDPEWSHLEVIHHRRPSECEAWLRCLAAAASPQCESVERHLPVR
jgi:adenylate kinase family enzyme